MGSSYFESLGRREAEPFSPGDELNYAETEPDLTKPVNENITKLIEDRKQLFEDSIAAYNKAHERRMGRFSDLEKLTTSGIKLINARQAYAEGDKYLQNSLEAYYDEDTRSRFISNEIAFEKENNRIKVEAAHETGTAKKTGEWTDGGKASNLDIADFELAVEESDVFNARHAVKEMNILLPEYMKIAEKTLIVDGKFYNEMNVAEKQKWRKIAYARYIEIWRAKYDISDRLIVSRFMKGLVSNEARMSGAAESLQTQASTETATSYREQGFINSVKAEYKNATGDGTNLASVDAIFSNDSFIQQREAHHRGEGKQNSYELANDDLVKLFTDNIEQFNEDEIQYFMEKYQFLPEGSVSKTTYSKLQSKNALTIWNAYNKHLSDKNFATMEAELNIIENQWEADKTIVDVRQLDKFLTDPKLGPRATKLRSTILDSQNLLLKDRFELQRYDIDNQIGLYLGDKTRFPDKYRNDSWKYSKTRAILSDMQDDWDDAFYDAQADGNSTEISAALATKAITTKLQEGGYDNAITLDASNTNSNVLVEGRKVFEENSTFAYQSNKPHEFELDGKLLENAENYLIHQNEKLDPIWNELARGLKGISGQKLAHDRLLATGRIKEPISGFGKIGEGLVHTELPKQNRDLLLNNNDYSQTNRVILSSDEDMNIVLNSLINPTTEDNGGIDAYKTDGKYTEWTGEKKLSEMTVGEVLTMIQNNELDLDDELGIYNIRGEALLSLVNNAPYGIDLDRVFDQRTQTLLLLERLRFKSNNRLMFGNSDMTYRRLVNVREEDREAFKKIIGDLGPFMDLSTLLPIAATELVEQRMP